MQFRIISDLHVDINHAYYSKFKFDPDSFYLIAGDVSGSRTKTSKFIKHASERGLKQGIFIEGNHMGYDRDWDFVDQTKEACYAYLAEQHPLSAPVCFMENNYKEIGENILVIGCTLYTDFQCMGNRMLSMRAAVTYMNDFRYVRTYNNLGDDRIIYPEDYEIKFYKSLQFIDQISKSNPTSKIVVVTHHGPSKQSLSREYVYDVLSAAYVSDLEEFIKSHSNIKLWCHGHVHSKFNYQISNCRILCHPFGYHNENGMKLTQYIGLPYDL